MNLSGPDIDKIEEAAKGGDAKAAYDLGWCYYIGNGVAQDKSRAWYWYTEAASRRSREASEILHVLEVEAARQSKLESLEQLNASQAGSRRPAIGLVIIALFLVSVVSVSTLRYVFRDEPSAPGQIGDVPTVAEESETSDSMDRQEPETESNGATELNEALQEGTSAPATPVRDHGQAVLPEKAAIQRALKELRRETSQPNDVPPPAKRVHDYNGIVEFAHRWLDEGNDVDTPE